VDRNTVVGFSLMFLIMMAWFWYMSPNEEQRAKMMEQRRVQDSMVGREVAGLFARAGRMPGQMVGKSEYLHAVHIDPADVARGQTARVRITSSGTNSLSGILI
jgi:tRNA A37 methylthiotransferase MiaB